MANWLGRYLESVGNFERALQIYQTFNDYASMIRIFCGQNRMKEAVDSVEKSKDCLAAYILAKSFETSGNIPDAIKFYNSAGSFRNSIRLAKEYDLKVELLQLALKSPSYITNEAANFFEETEEYDKAIILYEKLNNIPKALEICVASNDVENLSKLGTSLKSIH
jgi:intraflagellar transport protein 140